MNDRPFAKALFFIVLGGIVAWQLLPMLRSDPMAERLRLMEYCSPHHEEMVRWETITGSAVAAMDIGDAMENLCLSGTPRRGAVEAVNATIMPRRRI